jgi:predicted phage baseplate assembly protein
MNACACEPCACGCCEGIHVATPAAIFNRPGLSSLAYRVGTQARFLHSMKARLSSRDYPALQGLRTRDEDDFSIALLDGWATVADVLSFYQERLANEGFLRTASERRSVLELARLVGYEPRPGVAASVHLAFTLEAGHELTLAKGSRVQSVPGPGEKPQVFETSEDLAARSELNVLRPRLERPPYITRDRLTASPLVYLQGIATGLEVNDWLLLRFAGAKPEALYQVTSVISQAEALRTKLGVARRDPAPEAESGIVSPAPAEEPDERPPLAKLVAAVKKPASLQPPRARHLARDVAALYRGQSDLIPRLFGVLFPGITAAIYKLLGKVKPPGDAPLSSLEALRVKAALFGHNLPPAVSFTDGKPVTGPLPNLRNTWQGRLPRAGEVRVVILDGEHDQIREQSRIAIRRPLPDTIIILAASQRAYSYHTVTEVETLTLNAHNVSSRATILTLDTPWLSEDERKSVEGLPEVLRGTSVFAQSEELPRAPEPVTDDVTGDEPFLELDALHRGLEAGRFVIVEGERSDVLPGGPPGSNGAAPSGSGLVDAELAMVSEVAHRLATAPGTSHALPGDALHTFIRFAEPLAFRFKRDSVKVHANVVEATHGETKLEVLGSGDATRPFQTFALKQPPLTYVAAPTAKGAESTLELRVNEVLWREAEHLAGLGPADRRYQIRIEEEGRTSVVFGDGKRGARLPTGLENVEARYRSGIGRDGNVGAGRITLLLSRPLGLKEVTNPIRAAGGADRESRDQARRNAPLPTRALDRLVSVQDYADFARAFAGIGKASAVELSDGTRQLVHVTVAGAADVPLSPSADVFENLLRALRELGDPHQPLELAIRELLLLVVAARIRVAPDYAWDDVEPRLRAAMLAAFGFERRELGQDVLQAEVLGVVQGVPGVAYADLDTLAALREDDLARADPSSVLALAQRVPVELARFRTAAERAAAADPSPIAPAQIAVLTPDVPDTLVLSELR